MEARHWIALPSVLFFEGSLRGAARCSVSSTNRCVLGDSRCGWYRFQGMGEGGWIVRDSEATSEPVLLTGPVSDSSDVRRPTILYVAPGLPFPLTSGSALRNFNLIRAYARWG